MQSYTINIKLTIVRNYDIFYKCPYFFYFQINIIILNLSFLTKNIEKVR